MAHFENQDLGVSFDLPDKITVGDQLRYKGRVYRNGAEIEDIYVRYWYGARGMVQNWQCEVLPDANADIETLDNRNAADVIFWTGNVVAGHMVTLGNVEKN